jgi:hypothetical protein
MRIFAAKTFDDWLKSYDGLRAGILATHLDSMKEALRAAWEAGYQAGGEAADAEPQD